MAARVAGFVKSVLSAGTSPFFAVWHASLLMAGKSSEYKSDLFLAATSSAERRYKVDKTYPSVILVFYTTFRREERNRRENAHHVVVQGAFKRHGVQRGGDE